MSAYAHFSRTVRSCHRRFLPAVGYMMPACRFAMRVRFHAAMPADMLHGLLLALSPGALASLLDHATRRHRGGGGSVFTATSIRSAAAEYIEFYPDLASVNA